MSRRAAGVVALAFCGWQLLLGTSAAQSLEENLSKFGESTVKGYMQPVADGFGADMNSGLWHSAKTHGPLGFDVSIKFAAVTVPDEAKTFRAAAPPGYTPDPVTTATALGEENGGATVTGPGSATFEYPGGIGLDLLPVAVPQLTVGVPMRTDVMLRWLPSVEISDDVGKVKFWGLGAKHSLSQYLPLVPLDLAAYLTYQKFEVGDFLKSNHVAYGVMAGKSLPVISVYGALGFESSSMDLDYTLAAESPYGAAAEAVTTSLDSDASGRMTVGAKLSVVPLIFVNAEVSKVFGSDNLGTTFAGGLGLSMR